MIQILANVTCGNNTFTIDSSIPSLISTVVSIIKIGVPILLIIFGMLDLGKAVISNDEKEMKGAQGKLIRRCIYAALVFLVVAIVQFVIGLVDSDASTNSCISCFINDVGDCKAQQ